ncbi:MAG: NADH dehydrogenase [Cellvibrionaceae bacterium]|jgi:NADH dehydrogenase
MASPKIVIVGGGAGGLELATLLGKRLGKRGKADIMLVDQSPTHIWKPLLHEVAAGTLDATHDEENYFIHAVQHDYEFQLGGMINLDRDSKKVRLGPVANKQNLILIPEREISYDILIIAVGSTCNDFGTQGATEHCIFLDTRESADYFHSQFLNHYIAAHADDNASDTTALSIAIVGGGATGVELAAELLYAARQYYRLGLDEIQSSNVKITLIEAGPKILPALSEKVIAEASRELNRIGVEVLVNERVVEISEKAIKTESGKIILSSLKVWCAGIKAPDFLSNLAGLETNKSNQLVVTPTLQTTRDESIFAMGDCSSCKLGDITVPPRAQTAHQQALCMADNLQRYLKKDTLKPFVYTDRGSLISLSQNKSVGLLMGRLLGNVNIYGFTAKILYRSLYRSHQLFIYGLVKTGLLILSDLLSRSTGPNTKLH